MASIIYSANFNMIEYHRLNGNAKINFWRPMSQKRIANLHINDNVFFLTRNKYRNNEKVIVGYGKYVKSENLSIKRMWNKYKEMNGYDNQRAFELAVESILKGKELPLKMNSLILDKLIFFREPIPFNYLFPNYKGSVESYIYLDKGTEDATIKILEIGKKVGIDSWNEVISSNEGKYNQFEEDMALWNLSIIFQKIGTLRLTIQEKKNNQELIEKHLASDNSLISVPGCDYCLVKIANHSLRCTFYLQFSANKEKNTKLVGMLTICQKEIQKLGFNTNYIIVCSQDTGDYLKKYLNYNITIVTGIDNHN